MDKLLSKLVATVLVIVLAIYTAPMIMPAIRSVNATPLPIAPGYYVTPQTLTYTTSSPPPATFTVWVVGEAINGTDAWSVEVSFDPTQLAVVSSYTCSIAAASTQGDGMAGLFLGHTTTELGPIIGSNYVEASGTLLGSDYIPANTGNVLNITFSYIGPTPSPVTPTITSNIDPAYGLPPVGETLYELQSPTPTYPTGEIDTPNTLYCTFLYTFATPPLPTMVIENETSVTFGMFTNWTSPPTYFNEDIYIAGLNAAWGVTNATTEWIFNSTVLADVGYTPGPLWASVSVTPVGPGDIVINGTNLGAFVGVQDILLAIITFQIIYQGTTIIPGTYSFSPRALDNTALTSIYPLLNTVIVNGVPSIGTIPQTYPSPWTATEVIVYDFVTALPPYLSVSSVTLGPGPVLGDLFNVTVTLNNVNEPAQHLFAIQFRLNYDPTLMTFVQGFEGPFFPAAAAMDPNCLGTWFDAVNYPTDAINGPNVIVGDMILPNATGFWLEDSLPNGTGVVAILEFQVASQSFGEAPVTSGLNIEITNLLSEPDDELALGFITMSDGQPIQTLTLNPPIDGTYTISAVYNNAVVFDLYGGATNDGEITLVGGPYWQFPAPYGGQGPNNPMDLVLPQSLVYLWANLTYNYYPVTAKEVAFEVQGPNNFVLKLEAATDENGVAGVTFRMPWPDPDPASALGIYTVTATVSVSDVNYQDTMQYEYDYLLQIWKVTTDMFQYAHGSAVTTTIYYQSYAMQQYPALFITDILDNMSVPIGYSYLFLNPAVGSLNYPMFDVLTQYVAVMPPITIPTWAYAGIATLYTDAVTNWPADGGVPVTPEYVGPVIAIQPY
jgi:hypothetical protein